MQQLKKIYNVDLSCGSEADQYRRGSTRQLEGLVMQKKVKLIGKKLCEDTWIATFENLWCGEENFKIELPYPDDIDLGDVVTFGVCENIRHDLEVMPLDN